jgi:hypothetical protein
MLKTYFLLKNDIYRKRFLESESSRIVEILSYQEDSTPSRFWFDGLDMPQIAADTFNRPVFVYVTAKTYNSEGSDWIFLPFNKSRPNNPEKPIVLYLYRSHFYLVTLKSSLSVFPAMNVFHYHSISVLGLEFDWSSLYMN